MPSNPSLFYITAADYRAKTKVPDLVGADDDGAMSDDEVEELVLETMAMIDAYIGEGWIRNEDDQEFIFPRIQDEEDNTPYIPRSIALATRLIADAIVSKQSGRMLAHEVTSETNLGHSYTKKDSSQAESGFEIFPPSAIALLDKYRRLGGVFGINVPTFDTGMVQ